MACMLLRADCYSEQFDDGQMKVDMDRLNIEFGAAFRVRSITLLRKFLCNATITTHNSTQRLERERFCTKSWSASLGFVCYTI